jgi:hypothetical protein
MAKPTIGTRLSEEKFRKTVLFPVGVEIWDGIHIAMISMF